MTRVGDELVLTIKVVDTLTPKMVLLNQQMDKLEKESKQTGQATDKLFGGSALKAEVFGNLIANAVTAALRLARDAVIEATHVLIDFDKGLGDIAKTTGANEEELRRMAGALKDVGANTSTPLSGLQAIAATAGLLGISKDQVIEFTEVINRFSVATGLGAEDAAVSMAKIRNAFHATMGDSIENVERLGSALNELENTTAARAADIIRALSRMTTAAQLGLAPQALAGFADVLVSAGFAAERAGTLFNSALGRLVKQSAKIAEVMGITKRSFEEALSETPQKAITDLLKAIASIEDPVQKQQKILDIFGEEGGKAISALVTNVDGLTSAITTSEAAFKANISLQREYEAVSKTLSSKLGKLGNVIKVLLLESVEGLSGSMGAAIDALSAFGQELAGIEGKGATASGEMESLVTKARELAKDFKLLVEEVKGGADTLVGFAGWLVEVTELSTFLTGALRPFGLAVADLATGVTFLADVALSKLMDKYTELEDAQERITAAQAANQQAAVNEAALQDKLRERFGITVDQINALIKVEKDRAIRKEALRLAEEQELDLATALAVARTKAADKLKGLSTEEAEYKVNLDNTTAALQRELEQQRIQALIREGALTATQAAGKSEKDRQAVLGALRIRQEQLNEAEKIADKNAVDLTKHQLSRRDALAQVTEQMRQLTAAQGELSNKEAEHRDIVSEITRLNQELTQVNRDLAVGEGTGNAERVRALQAQKVVLEDLLTTEVANLHANDDSIKSIKDRIKSIKDLTKVQKDAQDAEKKVTDGTKVSIDKLATTFDKKYKLMQLRSTEFLETHKANLTALVNLTESKRKSFANLMGSFGDTFKVATQGFNQSLGPLLQLLDPSRPFQMGDKDAIKAILDQQRIAREAFEEQRRIAEAQLEILKAKQNAAQSGRPIRHVVRIEGGEAAIMALVDQVIKQILIRAQNEGGELCCV